LQHDPLLQEMGAAQGIKRKRKKKKLGQELA